MALNINDKHGKNIQQSLKKEKTKGELSMFLNVLTTYLLSLLRKKTLMCTNDAILKINSNEK